MCIHALVWLGSFIARDDGVTAIQTSLMGLLIGVVVIGAVTLVGGDTDDIFTALHQEMSTGNPNQ